MSYDIDSILKDMYNGLKRLERELYSLRAELSNVNSRISSLEKDVADIGAGLEKVKEGIRELNDRIDRVRTELTGKIDETRKYLNQRIENTRRELKKEINETRDHLEKKIADTEQRLDQHLAEQDEVLEIHGEGLLDSAVMQLMGILMPRLAPSTHVVVGQFNLYPLIVVEDEDRINLFCVVKEENQSVAEQIKRLAHLIHRYTGKDVNASIYAMKPREGAPLWLLRLASAEAPQLVEKK